MEHVIKAAVTPTLDIVVEKAQGVSEKWTLCLDYRALAKIEEKTGLDLKRADEWDKLTGPTLFPTVLWCCLQRYSAQVTEDQVRDELNPEAHHLLKAALMEMTFPDVAKALAAKVGASPNAPADPLKTA